MQLCIHQYTIMFIFSKCNQCKYLNWTWYQHPKISACSLYSRFRLEEGGAQLGANQEYVWKYADKEHADRMRRHRDDLTYLLLLLYSLISRLGMLSLSVRGVLCLSVQISGLNRDTNQLSYIHHLFPTSSFLSLGESTGKVSVIQFPGLHTCYGPL